VWKADTIVNDLGDTIILPEVIFSPIESSERYDSEGNLTWRAEFVSKDTVKEITFFKNGQIENEFTIVLFQPIDTILHYEPITAGRCIRKTSYWENGVLKNDHRANSPFYKAFNNDGTLFAVADSCDEYFSPIGYSKFYDSKTKKLNFEGKLFRCRSGVALCEDGWCKYYEDGVIVEMKFYDKEKLIEIKRMK
jgi:hypothetical protein